MIKRFLTIIFSFIGSLQVFSQNTEIAVQSDSIPLVEAITQIESKTSYHFYFRKEWLDALKVYKGLVKPPLRLWFDRQTSLKYSFNLLR